MYKLLIVDDEPLIRKGIKQLVDMEALSIDEVFEASNGREGLFVMSEKNPDIVLTDINMGDMDGLKLAKEIKDKNRNTQVVIITGYDYFEYAVAAIKAGVDDFVLKPVSKNDITEILKKQVAKLNEKKNMAVLLESIQGLQGLQGLQGVPDQRLVGVNNDNRYKELILKSIEQHLGDENFSLTVLAQEISLSVGYLSPLFKDIFGKPFQDYIIDVRLERAKILLLSSNMKIYEVASAVGFEDPNYFSTSFKKHFGMSPLKFKERSSS